MVVIILVDVAPVLWHGKVPLEACSVEACITWQGIPVQQPQIIFLQQSIMHVQVPNKYVDASMVP